MIYIFKLRQVKWKLKIASAFTFSKELSIYVKNLIFLIIHRKNTKL